MYETSMENLMAYLKPDKNVPYKVADISLADWGRKEIELSENEMPGLMAIRKNMAPRNP
jgi:adenosylhomocysteinase